MVDGHPRLRRIMLTILCETFDSFKSIQFVLDIEMRADFRLMTSIMIDVHKNILQNECQLMSEWTWSPSRVPADQPHMSVHDFPILWFIMCLSQRPNMHCHARSTECIGDHGNDVTSYHQFPRDNAIHRRYYIIVRVGQRALAIAKCSADAIDGTASVTSCCKARYNGTIMPDKSTIERDEFNLYR